MFEYYYANITLHNKRLIKFFCVSCETLQESISALTKNGQRGRGRY